MDMNTNDSNDLIDPQSDAVGIKITKLQDDKREKDRQAMLAMLREHRISDTCSTFIRARLALERASNAIDELINAEFDIPTMSIDQLQELIQKLPKHYKGARHLYEQIERIEDNKFKANQHKE